jgi:hypothetical protein
MSEDQAGSVFKEQECVLKSNAVTIRKQDVPAYCMAIFWTQFLSGFWMVGHHAFNQFKSGPDFFLLAKTVFMLFLYSTHLKAGPCPAFRLILCQSRPFDCRTIWKPDKKVRELV